MKKIFILISFVVFSFLLLPKIVLADSISCPDRFLTLINPVRDRSLWSDQSLNPIIQQYADIKKYSFSATWLLQYDTFYDQDLTNEIKSFDSKQEKGVFLEVSKKLANDANVAYPEGVRWSDPGAVFLSAYSQSDRIRLIDQIFSRYKTIYGAYPKSVGAWWVDSYSLNYMVKKYGVKSVLICADQKVTDSYGIWGQWWGFPYKPSKANILVPASATSNMENAVVLQWAQRDPILAYGGVGQFSRYSLQANDYVVVGKDINYFKQLSSEYLDCKNALGQITVGMETGMESLMQPVEYERQLNYLSTISGLNIVTMSGFATKYSKVYKINPDKIFFGTENAEWEMTTSYRKNDKLGENINYDQNLSFKDYFLKDNSNFLDRILPIKGSGNPTGYLPWFLVVAVFLGIVSIWKKNVVVFFSALSFCIASFGLIFRSGNSFGWLVFYGPVFENIILFQTLLLLIVFTLVWVTSLKLKTCIHNINLFLILLPLSFGLDTILRVLRVSNLNGGYFLGILVERTRLIGLTFSGFKQGFLNVNLPISAALSFLKIPLDKIWVNLPMYLIFYPLAHILITSILYLLLRKTGHRFLYTAMALLIFLFVLQLIWIFGVEPRIVLPTTS